MTNQIKYYSLNSLPTSAEIGAIYYLSNGSQYIGTSSNTFLPISDFIFVDEMPVLGIMDKIYVHKEADKTTLKIWSGTGFELLSGDEYDDSTILQAISTLQSELSTVQGKITTVESKITTNEGKISTLETKVNELENKEVDLTSIQTQLDFIENGVTTNTNNITNLQTVLENHESKLVSKNDGVHGLKVTKHKILFQEEVNGEWVEFDTASSILPSVTGFKGVSASDGSSITVSWKNPVNDEYIKTEVYASKIDISNLSIDELDGIATKVVDDNSTLEFLQNTNYGDSYYFKVYTSHNYMGVIKYANSQVVNVRAIDDVPPANVTDIKVSPSNERFTLTWTNPVDVDLANVKVVMKEGNYPTSHTDGTVIYEGTGNSVNANMLTNEIEYFIRFFVYDTTGNINSSTEMQVSIRPYKLQDITSLSISSDLTGTELTLNWVNPIVNTFNSIEVYVATSDLSLKTREQCINDGQLIYNGSSNTTTHNVVVNNTYYFKIFTNHIVDGVNTFSDGISVNKKAEDKEPPSIVTNVKIKAIDGGLEVRWSNPIETDLANVRLHYSLNEDVNSIEDGVVAYNGSGNSVTITGLENEVNYYLRFFTVDINGNVNSDVIMKYIGVPTELFMGMIYGVKIDTTNSNPETAVTYTDDAVGFTPAKMNFTTDTFDYGSWQNIYPFNQIKPCVLKNGVVQYYLNPNDYTQKIDGTPADITSGNDGDVMVEFPKIYWKFERVGTDLYVRYAEGKADRDYKCLAHMRGITEKDKTYISAYLGTVITGSLRSLSNKTLTSNNGIGVFRTQAQANGVGYDQMTYYQLLMLQLLYLIMFKNRDSQTSLGRGYVDGNSATIITGGTNAKGLFYGETTGKKQMKFCGIEDFYGNLVYWIEGLFCDANRNILIGTENFNSNGEGYSSLVQGAITSNGYMSDIQGGTETGFIIKGGNGSTTTHWTDDGGLNISTMPTFGGYWKDGDKAGAFRLDIAYGSSDSYGSFGARLISL